MESKEKLILLKKEMDILNERKEELAMRQGDFNNENKVLLDNIKDSNESIESCKDVLRGEAESGFFKDGLKQRLGGIGIRVSQITVYDEAEALSWAKEKDLFLQLDKRGFEKVAKTGEIDFVKLEDKVTVTFPKEIMIEE